MMEFTKEQLIGRVKQATAINRRRISANPDATGLVMDNELFAIALAALTAPVFMYGIADDNGKAHFDERCVGSDAGILQDEVDCLNEMQCEHRGDFAVVALFRLPEVK